MQVAAPQPKTAASIATLDNIEAGFTGAPQQRQAEEAKEADPDIKGAPTDDKPAAEAKEPKGAIHKNEKAPIADQSEEPEMSAEEKALLGIEDTPAVELNDDHKKFVKDFFGADDPEALKTEFSKIKEEHDTYSKENAELRAFRDRLNKLDPHVARALELELADKGSGQKYLKGLPAVDILNKDIKKLSDREALDAYVPDHGITDEHWAMLKDELADPGVVDALNKRISFLRPNADALHKQAQGALKEEREAEGARQREFQSKYNESVAAAIAHVKNGPMKQFYTEAHGAELRNGTVAARFFQEDGITPKAELLEIIIKAEKYESMKKAAERFYNKGRGDGAHEMMSGLPATPRSGRAAPTATPQKTNPYVETLDNIEKSVR